jgi:putative PIN family toxin of toxin-antitoxin system
VRITLDSNILVRAVTSPHGPALRLLNIVLGAHTLVLSRFILDEVGRVLLYPRLQMRFQITASEIARLTGNLADAAQMVEPVIVRPLVISDPDDDAVLYTAADGKADVLCTRNVRHFAAADVQAFCAARGIRVMTDLDVLLGLSDQGPAEPGHGSKSGP